MDQKTELQALHQAFLRLTQYAAQSNCPDAVTTTLQRVLAREANVVFDEIRDLYQPEEARVARKQGSQTKVLLIKPVGDRCNLRCSYCYETLRLAESREKVMKVAKIEHYLATFVGKDSGVTDIFLHGGEPLLAGKSFFQSFIQVLQRMELYGKIALGVQTNATLLDDEWVAFFKQHHFRVGISLDGDESIHDRYRKDSKGQGSYQAVRKGMALLQQQDVPFGVICVVSAETAAVPGSAKRILEHFSSLGLQYIDIHPAFTPKDRSGGAAADNLSARLYTRFMTELAEAWLACKQPGLRLRCMEDIFENLSAVKSSTCYAGGLCTRIMGMDPSGNLSPCTRPFHSKYTFGNAGWSSLPEVEQEPAFQQFVTDEAAGRQRAADCPWSSLCGAGGCPHERFTDGRQDPAGRHIYCTCSMADAAETGYPGFYRQLSRLLNQYLEDSVRETAHRKNRKQAQQHLSFPG